MKVLRLAVLAVGILTLSCGSDRKERSSGYLETPRHLSTDQVVQGPAELVAGPGKIVHSESGPSSRALFINRRLAVQICSHQSLADTCYWHYYPILVLPTEGPENHLAVFHDPSRPVLGAPDLQTAPSKVLFKPVDPAFRSRTARVKTWVGSSSQSQGCLVDGKTFSLGWRLCSMGEVLECSEEGTWVPSSQPCELGSPEVGAG